MEKQVCVCVHTYTYRNKCYCIFETIIISIKCIILDFNSGVFVSVRIEMIIPDGKRSARDLAVSGSDPEPERAAAPALNVKIN